MCVIIHCCKLCDFKSVCVCVCVCIHIQNKKWYNRLYKSHQDVKFSLEQVKINLRNRNRLNKISVKLPGWCGSVDWALACEPKGHWLDSQSGHMPGLQARSPVGSVQAATTHWCFPLSFPSPLSKKINK